jgi:NAD(P)-dependent dehydrogenase (short-subunit alcohol dehydrogenase family)
LDDALPRPGNDSSPAPVAVAAGQYDGPFEENPMATARPDFPDGVALVIGGSGGNGKAICEALADAGSDVALTYHRNAQRAEETVAAVSARGRKATAHALSIGDAEGVRKVVEAVGSRQRIHTVVIAAGSDITQPLIRDLQPAEWKKVVDADLNGFFNVVHATLPHLRRGGGGSYVHISSAGLHRWPPGDVLSVAPKAAIEALIKGIAKEEGASGIRANSVAIGVIETGIFLRLWANGTFDEEWKRKVHAGLCLKRWGKSEEVADATVFLASNRAQYITGQMISVDGGYGV